MDEELYRLYRKLEKARIYTSFIERKIQEKHDEEEQEEFTKSLVRESERNVKAKEMLIKKLFYGIDDEI